jgi:hypothetical protein
MKTGKEIWRQRKSHKCYNSMLGGSAWSASRSSRSVLGKETQVSNG